MLEYTNAALTTFRNHSYGFTGEVLAKWATLFCFIFLFFGIIILSYSQFGTIILSHSHMLVCCLLFCPWQFKMDSKHVSDRHLWQIISHQSDLHAQSRCTQVQYSMFFLFVLEFSEYLLMAFHPYLTLYLCICWWCRPWFCCSYWQVQLFSGWSLGPGMTRTSRSLSASRGFLCNLVSPTEEDQLKNWTCNHKMTSRNKNKSSVHYVDADGCYNKEIIRT